MQTQLKITTTIRGDYAIATIRIPTRDGGPMVLHARVSLADVRRAARMAAHRAQLAGDELGWGFFKKIAKSVKKAAKKIARSKLVKSVSKIANNPLVSMIIPPQITMGLKVLKTVSKITGMAKAGDPRARAVVRRAKAQAAWRRNPSPTNKRALRSAIVRGRRVKGSSRRGAYTVTDPRGRVFKTMVALS